MADLKEALSRAFDLVDRRENEAALQVINEVLAGLKPPDRVGDIPPARATVYDWLQLARQALTGEPVLVPPKAALRSALALLS